MLYGRILRCPLAAATVTSLDLSAGAARCRASGRRSRSPSPAKRCASPARRSRRWPPRPPSRPSDALARDPRRLRAAAVRRRHRSRARGRMRRSSSRARPRRRPRRERSSRAPRACPATATCSGRARAPRATSRQGFREGRRHRRGDLRRPRSRRTPPWRPTASWPSWEGDELTVWASTQGIFVGARRAGRGAQDPGLEGPRHHRVHGRRLRREVRRRGSRASRRPGSRSRPARPVKLFLDRKEEQLATGNRPSSVQTSRPARRRTASSPPSS